MRVRRARRAGGTEAEAPAQGGRARSVRARPRYGSVAARSGGAAAARHRDCRAQVAPRPARYAAQTGAPDRGSHSQAARASAQREGLRSGVLV